ncbi:MAG: hypothetical protein ACC612_11435 [Methanomethylovorans sp.]|uniref:hypothetical protein n=1 Tax=Methanomethylovorans sp. TaxID=2758717 RepID=UPI0035311668
MSIVVDNGETMDVYTDRGGFTLSKEDYSDITALFSRQGVLLGPTVLRPTDIINYLDEQNPKLTEAIVQIEKEKQRRRMANPLGEHAKTLLPIIVIIIVGVIAFKMLTSGGGTSAVGAATSSVPIVLK